jgi:hypothetical protein
MRKVNPASRISGPDFIDHDPGGNGHMSLTRVTHEEPWEWLTPLKQKRHKFACFNEFSDGILDAERDPEAIDR